MSNSKYDKCVYAGYYKCYDKCVYAGYYKCYDIWVFYAVTIAKDGLTGEDMVGNIVEFLLKFFYSSYYEDYLQVPSMNNNKTVKPEVLNFD